MYVLSHVGRKDVQGRTVAGGDDRLNLVRTDRPARGIQIGNLRLAITVGIHRFLLVQGHTGPPDQFGCGTNGQDQTFRLVCLLVRRGHDEVRAPATDSRHFGVDDRPALVDNLFAGNLLKLGDRHA